LIGLGEVHLDLAGKAAALGYRLAKSQACLDGNKRVAVLLVAEFLALNGAELNASNEELVAIILAAAASDAAAQDETTLMLTEWFQPRLRPWTEEDD
jgi:death on curing protein